MKVGDLKVGEVVDDIHDLWLDNFPTLFEEGSGKSVRARVFVTWEGKDGSLDLLHSERHPQICEVAIQSGDEVPIEVLSTGRSFF